MSIAEQGSLLCLACNFWMFIDSKQHALITVTNVKTIIHTSTTHRGTQHLLHGLMQAASEMLHMCWMYLPIYYPLLSYIYLQCPSRAAEINTSNLPALVLSLYVYTEYCIYHVCIYIYIVVYTHVNVCTHFLKLDYDYNIYWYTD